MNHISVRKLASGKLSARKLSLKKLAFFILMLALQVSCTALLSKEPLQTTYYTLERAQSKPQSAPLITKKTRLPILIVNTPKAAPGFDTQRMIYTRAPHQLEYFARNEWVDTPAHMLRPLMISAIEKTGAFNAVLDKQSVVASDLRLESEIIKLVQNFNNKPINNKPINNKPSYVQFTLRVTMIDNVTNKVIALQEFDERVDASSDNPMGGVAAANLAVNQVLNNLSLFTQKIVTNWVESRLKLPENF